MLIVSRAIIRLIDKDGSQIGKPGYTVITTDNKNDTKSFTIFDNLEDLNRFINEFRDEFDLKE